MAYQYVKSGATDCSIPPDLSKIKDKSVIVTGGSSGLGAAYVKAFVAAGAFVTNADLNENAEHKGKANYQYVKCDVTSWQDQLAVFKAAITNLPTKGIDVVVANAGIGGNDSIFQLDESDEPTEPALKTVRVNYIGVLYTAKLALHYFNKQEESRDRCLIIKGSLASYLDLPGGVEYQSSKFGVRGLMCCLRMTGKCRVNLLAPWWSSTGIMNDTFRAQIDAMLKRIGSQWVDLDDAAKACLRIASDETIHGKGFIICSHEMDPNGWADMAADDYEDRDDAKHLQHIVRVSKGGRESIPGSKDKSQGLLVK